MYLRAKTSKGFTLIELSVVILFLALFAAVIVPNLGRQKDSRMEAQFYEGTRRLAVQARNTAIQRGQTILMKYDDGSQTFEVLPDGDGATTLASFVAPSAVKAQTFLLEGADSNASEWQISFFGDGRATAGSVSFNSGKTLVVSANGSVQMISGAASTDADSWEAGQIEQRQ